ncbi:uncharacterized protein LOC105171286 isoform X2 [Sesamum indicum]|uniref:Uncharacterized protein LOC105171286 isoform X2 n=1 Tax=Sesamum indicum TaxID=4182 RepID=A0A8M8V359_SESIN|nr:uncharacterized protein LOC105171286 isoform X2 [Sesamum indicum]
MDSSGIKNDSAASRRALQLYCRRNAQEEHENQGLWLADYGGNPNLQVYNSSPLKQRSTRKELVSLETTPDLVYSFGEVV